MAALRRFRISEDAKLVNFTIKYLPFQLYPEASKEGEDKYEWYRKSRYGDSEEKMKMYTTLMSAYGVSAGIDFKFGGLVANTLDAHRLVQYFQEEKGPETADKLIACKMRPVNEVSMVDSLQHCIRSTLRTKNILLGLKHCSRLQTMQEYLRMRPKS